MKDYTPWIIVPVGILMWFMGYGEGKKNAAPPPAPTQIVIQCPNCNVAK